MTGMFEAYPVDESARLRGSGWSLAAHVIPRTPSATRGTHGLAGCPRGRCVRTWRTHFYHGADFRSKTAERQLANFTFIKEIFPLNTVCENLLVDLEGILLLPSFCVRLRFSIRRCFKKQTIESSVDGGPTAAEAARLPRVTSTAAPHLCFSYDADSGPLRPE
jgi:hypothetical protein